MATDGPVRKQADSGETEPYLGLTSGYVQRSVDQFPRQGAQAPWRVHQNYVRDLIDVRASRLDDGVMQFGCVVPRGTIFDEARAAAS